MASGSTLKTSRNIHLLRAAQSAGEAFACPVSDDRVGDGIRFERLASLAWISAGLIATAGLYFAF